MKNAVITYEDYQIVPVSNGFESYAVEETGSAAMDKFAIGSKATYAVKQKGKRMNFVFAVSAVDAMAEPNSYKFKEENLSKEAVNIIRRLIDNEQIVPNKEATFEFRSHGFYEVYSPIWLDKN